jgi:HTH-type transcriptional regulator / antitoxin HigA
MNQTHIAGVPARHPDELQPDWALHPGTLLARYLNEHGIRQSELAERTGLTAKHVNQIIKKAVGITPDVAVLLETALGTPRRFWAQAGADWDMHVSEQKAATSFQESSNWALGFDRTTLLRHGIITAADTTSVLTRKVLRFFRVASPAAFEATWVRPRTSFKRSQAYTVHGNNTALWLRLVEHYAEQLELQAPYRPAALRKVATKIPTYTTMPFTAGFEAAQAALAEAGVALIFVRQVPGTRVCAATWWVGDTPVIGITERGRRTDGFWFSILHEIGHILHHARRATFLDLETDKHESVETADEAEAEASRYAANVLVPERAKVRIAAAKTKQELLLLAAELNVSAAIVAGQHGHLTKNWRTGGSLRATFTEEDITRLEELSNVPAAKR